MFAKREREKKSDKRVKRESRSDGDIDEQIHRDNTNTQRKLKMHVEIGRKDAERKITREKHTERGRDKDGQNLKGKRESERHI